MGHAKRAKCSSRQKILHLSLALRNEPSGALRRASCYCQAPAPPPTKHHPPAVVPLSPPRSEHGRFKPMASSRLSTTGLQEHVKDMCWGSSGGFPSVGRGRCWISTRQYPASRRRHHEHIPIVDEFLGYFWYTRTRTRNIGYPNCQVFIFQGNFRVLVFETRNLKNWNYPIRIFRATRLPSHTW